MRIRAKRELFKSRKTAGGLAKLVGRGRRRNGVGGARGIYFDGVVNARAGDVADADEGPGKAGDFDVGDAAFLMLTSEMPLAQEPVTLVREKPSRGLFGVDAGGVDELRAIGDADVGEFEVFEGGDALVAGDGILVLDAAGEGVDAEEAAGKAGGIADRRRRCLR